MDAVRGRRGKRLWRRRSDGEMQRKRDKTDKTKRAKKRTRTTKKYKNENFVYTKYGKEEI